MEEDPLEKDILIEMGDPLEGRHPGGGHPDGGGGPPDGGGPLDLLEDKDYQVFKNPLDQ